VQQSDLEFLRPSDLDTYSYIELDIILYIRGKLVSVEGKDLGAKDFTAVTINFLHSLFCQCNITLNSMSVTRSIELYQYRSYLETFLTYDSDAVASHPTISFYYLDNAIMLPCDPTVTQSARRIVDSSPVGIELSRVRKYSFMAD